MKLRLVLTTWGLIATATVARPAVAAPEVAGAAADVGPKERADALMDDLKFAEAYGLYARAYEIDPDPALLYNQGRALEAMGDYPEALEKLTQFAKVASPELRARVGNLEALITEIKARVSTLVVTSNVAGARVSVRRKLVGSVTGATSFSVRAGRADVEVVADGYESWTSSVELPAGDTMRLTVKLDEKGNAARLVVRANPGAVVFVGDKPIGPAPIETRLPPGRYEVRVRKHGFLDELVPLTLAAGESRAVDVQMREPPPITAKWWFWTAAGVVVAGGVVLAVALSQEKAPSDGDKFSPSQVRGPLTIGF